jgi:hypothetical protein
MVSLKDARKGRIQAERWAGSWAVASVVYWFGDGELNSAQLSSAQLSVVGRQVGKSRGVEPG